VTAFILKANSSGTYARAAAVIEQGGLVAFPTETVYGLGADATNAQAVARIYEAKGRPKFNPLIVHVATKADAEALAEFSPTARRLASAFWPGALTLVLPRRRGCPISDMATAGLDTVALRVPSEDVAHAFLKAAGTPIAAPSANLSGHVSPTDARHVMEDLGERIDAIIDGGATALGVESTILSVTGEAVRLLRPGGATKEDIEAVLGRPVETGPEKAEVPQSPGQLPSHYAPHVPVRLNATSVSPDEALLAFGRPLDGAAAMLNLSEEGDLGEAAAHLYAMLRALDDRRFAAIAVMPVPMTGLGLAINDRLKRAAAPRPTETA
jgi:L-threonylcarbamoyladenylate synthase